MTLPPEHPPIDSEVALPEPFTQVPCMVLLVAACLGIVADRWLSLSWTGCWLASVVGLLSYGWSRRRQPPSVLAGWGTGALLIATVLLAAGWHHRQWSIVPADHLERWLPSDESETIVQLKGRLASPVEYWRPTGDVPGVLTMEPQFRLELHVSHVRQQGAWHPTCGRVMVHGPGHLRKIEAGHELILSGQLARFAAPHNPGQVDRRAYYRGRGISAILRVPHADCIRAKSVTLRPRYWASRLRDRWASVLRKYLSVESSGLAGTLLLGESSDFSPQRREAFQRTGTSHILAISGLHLGILAAVFLRAIRAGLLPFRLGLTAVILLVAGYACLTKSQAPVVRATVLVQLVCVGWFVRRHGSFANSLGAAGLLVLAYRPTDLFQAGTQLSFLAVAALARAGRVTLRCVPTDPLDYLVWRTRPWPVRVVRWWTGRTLEVCAVGTAVWLVTMPLVVLHFNLITPLAVPLSILAGPPLTVSLFSAFALIILHELGGMGTGLAAIVCDQSVRLLEFLVRRAAGWSWAYCWMATPDELWIAGGYLCLLLAWAWAGHRRRMRLAYGLATIVFAIGMGWPVLQRHLRTPSVLCTFLAVGHGACVVIQLPDGEVCLYDAGRMGATNTAVNWVSRYLWSQGITRVDRVFLSHVDADHFNLLPALCERFRPRSLHVTRAATVASHQTLQRLSHDLRRSGVATRQLAAPARWSQAGCEFQVLYPSTATLADSDNANSLVLLLRYRGRSILLTGDLEGSGLDDVLRRGRRHVDVAMAPHHGSLRSEPAAFVEWCTPTWLVISGRNRDGIDAYGALLGMRGTTLLNTAVHGAVEIALERRGLRVEPFRR